MSDLKISQLPTKATPIAADIVPIVDSVDTTNKKITIGTLPISTATQTALNAKVTGNTAITGATKTKITYDSKGLVTSGADATTADITDSTDKRYVTDANLVVIGNTSGTNTGDQDLSALALKATTISTTAPLAGGGDLSANRTLSIPAATTSADGYLTSTDWNTFNGKQNALGFTPENSANKTTNFTGNTGSNTLFPTVKAIYDALVGYLASYQPILGFNPASESLSNLDGVAINADLLPDTDSNYNIGQSGQNWNSIAAAKIGYDGATAIDLDSRKMFDTNEKESMNFEGRILSDSSNISSVDYQNRQLLDTVSNASVQYGNRALLDSAGVESVNWESRYLADDSEIQALDWIDRRLWSNDGSTVTLDWSSADGLITITQPIDDNSTFVATTAYVDTQPKTKIETFTTSGTWTKDPRAKRVTVVLRGGSGGGGGGRRGASATNRFGGGSGVVSSIAWMSFNPSDLGATENYVVGAGGTAGAAATVNDTNGGNGGAGGESNFGTVVRIRVPASAGGSGGTGAAGAAGVAQAVTISPFSTVQVAGSTGTSAIGSGGGSRTDIVASTSSGGGAGSAGANGSSAGGAGGQFTANSFLGTKNGGAGGAAGGSTPGAGSVDTGTKFMGMPIGTGAGGGGSNGNGSGAGSNGGNGFTSGGVHLGGAGGGGGASTNGFNSGAGGIGSNGVIVVITEY
jgi:hypothetical protein